MIVAGIPEFIGSIEKVFLIYTRYVGEEHVTEIAAMALDLLAGSVVFQVPHKPNKKINLRMGFHR